MYGRCKADAVFPNLRKAHTLGRILRFKWLEPQWQCIDGYPIPSVLTFRNSQKKWHVYLNCCVIHKTPKPSQGKIKQ